MRSPLTVAALMMLGASPAVAQPFDPGPRISVPGSSVSGMRIDGAPKRPTRGIPNAPVFGDTVEERAYGRDYELKLRASERLDSELRVEQVRVGANPGPASCRSRPSDSEI